MFEVEAEIFLGESDFAKEIRRLIRIFADSHIPIFIDGEEGSGKSFLGNLLCAESARTINFQYVNCRDFELLNLDKKIQQIASSEAIEGDVFFLDNYECVSELEKKRIAMIVKNNQSCRFIFSSSLCAIEENVLDISSVRFHLIPLRDRKEDIQSIANFYLQKWSSFANRATVQIEDDALTLLKSYSWPQNVHELKAVLWKAFGATSANFLSIQDFDIDEHRAVQDLNIQFQLGDSMEEIELRIIKKTLDACDGNKVQAAKSLGINVRTIYRKLEDVTSLNI